MPGGVRCSFFRVVLVALLLVALLQLLYLSLLSNLHGQQQPRSAHPVHVGIANSDSQWQREQKDHLKAVLATGGVLDGSGQYRIYHHLLAREGKPSKSLEVALASHTSLNNIGHLQDLVQRWDGKISLALFASSSAQAKVATVLMFTIAQLCPSVQEWVFFHLVCQSGDQAFLPELDHAEFANLQTCQAAFAKATSMGKNIVNYAGNASYPNNLLRNVAKDGVKSTAYVLVMDIDMVPSERLRTRFLDLAARGLDSQTVYVLPAFEIRHTRRLPGSKEELLRLYQVGEVRAFYEELCPRCQAPTNYSAWVNLPESSDKLAVAYNVEWRDPWEPFYIGAKDVPSYDERFKQYGFNRISQACELNIAGFTFAVLDSAFLVHKGHKLPGDFHSQKDAENKRNRQIFRGFKEELKLKYPDSTRRC